MIDIPPKILWLPPKPAIIRSLERAPLELGNFLPGMSGVMSVEGPKGPPTAISVPITAQQDTDGPMNWPAGVRKGDVAVLFEVSRNTAGGGALADVDMTASGWASPILNQSDATIGTVERDKISHKILTGSEGASFTGLSGSSNTCCKLLVIVRGNAPISSVGVSTVNNQVTTGNPTAQNNTSGSGTPPLIVFGWYMASAAVDPRTMSPAKDSEININAGSRDVWVAWKIYNSSPSNVSVDMDDEGTNYLRSFFLSLS